MIRKTLFWVHLAVGVLAGLIIALSCVTGAIMAFRTELVEWSERAVRRVEAPAGATALPLAKVVASAQDYLETFDAPSGVKILPDPEAAIAVSFGRDQTVWVNPYSGEAKRTEGENAVDAFIEGAEQWHRFLGRSGASKDVGKTITGITSLIFLFLVLSGLYLWFPRRWSWRSVKAVSVPNPRLSGKARDFNWHNALGLWAAPVLLVLTITSIPLAHRWGNDLVFRIVGEQPPPPRQRGEGGERRGGNQAPVVQPPSEGAKPRSLDQQLSTVNERYPNAVWIQLRPDASAGKGARHALVATVLTADALPRNATLSVTLDPFTGAILKTESPADQTAGRQLRTWFRFLHTGEALGLPGKIAAFLACLVGLVLVYTGFALTWRRFFKRSNTAAEAPTS